jgi:hypothetical protein
MLTNLLNVLDGKAFCSVYSHTNGITCEYQQPTATMIDQLTGDGHNA